MFGSMVARCQQTAALKLNVSRMYPQNAVGMRKIVEKEEAKLPGQVQLPYGKQVGIVCLDLDDLEKRIIAYTGQECDRLPGTTTGRINSTAHAAAAQPYPRWVAPTDRATFPQDDDSIETSEREAR